RTELRFGESEAADGLALCEKRKPFVFLRVIAVGVDGVHDERALNGDEAAEAGVAALKFLCHETVGAVGHASATVAVEAGAEETEFAELRNEMLGECAFAAVLFDDGDNFGFDELTSRLASEFFLVVEERIEVDVIDAVVGGHRISWS